MSRTKAGLGVAAALFILIAWLWPGGSEPDEGRSVAEQAADGSASPGPPSASGTESESPEPSEAPASESASPSPSPSPSPEPAPAEPAANAFDGPLGTRDRTGSDVVALTFDDGPDPKWTPRVLDELRARGVKATFCVIGAYAEAHPDLIADIVHDGHTLCSHTWFHEMDLGEWTEAEIRANLRRTNDAIEQAAPGAKVEYFRHPGGRWTERAIRVAADMGMESIHWTVDPSDWDKKTTEAQIREHVLEHAVPGSIVLLHDGASNQKHTLAALKSILDEFGRRGYNLVAL